MSFVVTAMGALILALSLAGVALGTYMATDPKTCEPGKLFALWWVPGIAAALGVFMRDFVTFFIGIICFLVAGVVLFLSGGTDRPSTKRKRGGTEDDPSARTTRENRTRGYRREAS